MKYEGKKREKKKRREMMKLNERKRISNGIKPRFTIHKSMEHRQNFQIIWGIEKEKLIHLFIMHICSPYLKCNHSVFIHLSNRKYVKLFLSINFRFLPSSIKVFTENNFQNEYLIYFFFIKCLVPVNLNGCYSYLINWFIFYLKKSKMKTMMVNFYIKYV